MELGDSERYALAALYTLAVHSTQMEAGVLASAGGDSGSAPWGCPNDDLLDDLLLASGPIHVPPEQLQQFWGFDCIAPAGLCCRVYAYLGIPRKAWPGLLRMPEVPRTSRGSEAALEDFVMLVRRYSAFLDPNLIFTTGAANRLQQQQQPPANALQQLAAQQQQQQEQQDAAAGEHSRQGEEGEAEGATPLAAAAGDNRSPFQQPEAAAAAEEAAGGAGGGGGAAAITADAAVSSDSAGTVGSSAPSMATPATTTASSSSSSGVPQHGPTAASRRADSEGDNQEQLLQGQGLPAIATHAVPGSTPLQELQQQQQQQQQAGAHEQQQSPHPSVQHSDALDEANPHQHSQQQQQSGASVQGRPLPQQQQQQSEASVQGQPAPPLAQQQQSEASVQGQPLPQQQQQQGSPPGDLAGALEGLAHQVDTLPKEAAEGTVVPEATFNPAESYHHAVSHKAVLALYELIGGCLCSNTDDMVEDLRGAAGGAAPLGQAPDLRRGSDDADSGAGHGYSLAGGGGGSGAVGAAASGGSSTTSGGSFLFKLFGGSSSSSAAAAGAGSGGCKGPAGGPAHQHGSPTKRPGTPKGAWFPEEEWASGGTFNLAAADEDEGGAVGPLARSTGAAGGTMRSAATAAAAAGGAPSSSKGWSWWSASSSSNTSKQQQQQRPSDDDDDDGGYSCLGGGAPGGPTSLLEEEEDEEGNQQAQQQQRQQPSSRQLKGDQEGEEDEDDAPYGGTPRTGGGGSSGDAYQSLADTCTARVRWYDARARIAVKRVAHWLRVPWPKVCAFEHMWVMAALQLDPSLATSSHRPRHTTLTYFKVGAAAIGGGALLALTGGLAAPAIAAGLGAAVTLVHGGAAAAAAVSGFAGSAVGTAAMTGVFGAWGASTAGGSATALFSDIQEWGFWDVSQSIYVEGEGPEEAAGAGAAAASGGSVTSSTLSSAAAASTGGAGTPKAAQGGSGSSGSPSSRDAPSTPQASSSSSSTADPATTAAVAAAAAGSPTKAAAAASGGAASSGGLLGTWFKKGKASVYVPLLPVPVHPKRRDEPRMALTIAVSGCISSMEDFVAPWRGLPARDCERFALVWESAILQEVNVALTSFITQQAVQQVTTKTLQTFFYTGLVGALALPMALTTAIRVGFGSKWRVALRRAQIAGKLLAASLMQGFHGDRPVTLVGCSMGARLIFHCLLELQRQGASGLVEHAVLLGTPVSCRPERWAAARRAVAGRLINGYSVNDWTLGVLYRAHSSSSIWLQAAGIWQVGVAGVENVNLSKLVAGHQDYLSVTGDILEVLNLHC